MKTRSSKYQLECPFCGEFFAWHHCCPKNDNKNAVRGIGKDRNKIIAWNEPHTIPSKHQ
jgi:hypothetical protein